MPDYEYFTIQYKAIGDIRLHFVHRLKIKHRGYIVSNTDRAKKRQLKNLCQTMNTSQFSTMGEDIGKIRLWAY